MQPVVTKKNITNAQYLLSIPRKRNKDECIQLLQQVFGYRAVWFSVSKHSTRLKQRQMDVSPPSPLRTGYTATHGNARRHRHPSVQRLARMTTTRRMEEGEGVKTSSTHSLTFLTSPLKDCYLNKWRTGINALG